MRGSGSSKAGVVAAAAAWATWAMAVSGVLVASAAAAAECPLAWSPEQVVNTPGPNLNYQPRIGVDDAGWATVAWSESDGGKLERILVSRRPPGGEWQAPQQVATTVGVKDSDSHSMLDLAVGPGGHALLTWYRDEQIPRGVRPWAAYFNPATGWSAPFDLQVPGEKWAHRAGVAVNRAGVGVVGWLSFKEAFIRLVDPVAGWLPLHRVRDRNMHVGNVGSEARLAINDAGQVAMAYLAWQPTVVRFDPAVGELEAPQRLVRRGELTGYRDPEMAMTPAGEVFVTWSAKPTWGEMSGALLARYQPGAGWQPVERVSGPNTVAWAPDVAVNAQGEAVVAWQIINGDASKRRMEAARYRPGAGWGAPLHVFPLEFYEAPQVWLSDEGTASVTSSHGEATYRPVETFSMQAPSDKVRRDEHPDLGYDEQMAGSPNGNLAVMAVVWDPTTQYPGPAPIKTRVLERHCADAVAAGGH